MLLSMCCHEPLLQLRLSSEQWQVDLRSRPITPCVWGHLSWCRKARRLSLPCLPQLAPLLPFRPSGSHRQARLTKLPSAGRLGQKPGWGKTRDRKSHWLGADLLDQRRSLLVERRSLRFLVPRRGGWKRQSLWAQQPSETCGRAFLIFWSS